MVTQPSPASRPSRPTFDSDFLRPYLVVVGMVAAMWAVELVDLLPRTDLDSWGIRPRQVRGLPGIAFAPFLHDGIGHLLGNTLAFLVLGWIVAAGGVHRFVQVTVIVALCAGLGTWLVGSANSIHVGASGLVFGYLGYLVTRGVFARQVGLILVGLFVLLVYGGLLWGLFPRPGISWQGHLFGLAGGVLAAWVVHGERSGAQGDGGRAGAAT